MPIALDDFAESKPFADLVGITPQHVNNLRRRAILLERGTYESWIFTYCQYLRRHHDHSARYMAAKTADLEASAALKHTRIQASIDALAAEYQSAMDAWAVHVRTQVLAAGNIILNELSVKGIEIEDRTILDPLRTALHRARDVPGMLEAADADGGDEDGPSRTDPDELLGRELSDPA